MKSSLGCDEMIPAIVVVSQYVTAEKVKELKNSYDEFVDYIDREEAKSKRGLNKEFNVEKLTAEQLLYMYLDYMNDSEKQGELFTANFDFLNEDEHRKLKEAFALAQKNESPMWQDVISFDNAWLEKQGLYDCKTGQLDEVKMKNIVREAMKELLKNEKMEDSAVWTAAIHYNTDNIHVHIATVEPFPTREKKWFRDKETGEWSLQYKAKRKQSSIDKMKSKVANMIVDRSEFRNRIDELIRGTVKEKKSLNLDLSSYRKTKKLFLIALEKLPNDRRQWFYGYHTINDARPYIDEIVDIYLNTFHKKEMKELDNLLDEEVQVMKELYGEGSRYEKYKETKLNDLRKRMGNAVLAEMRAYVKKELAIQYQNKSNNYRFIYEGRWQSRIRLDRAIRNLNYHMRKTYYDYQKERNLEEFDRMLETHER